MPKGRKRATAPAPTKRVQAEGAWPATSADIESDLGPDETAAEFRRTLSTERKLVEREIRKRMDRIRRAAPADGRDPA